MGFLSKLWSKRSNASENGTKKKAGSEDFMSLIRVYLQAAMAETLGFRDLKMFPDLRAFKQSLRVPTLNNRIGTGEKRECRKMMNSIYGMPESFFDEIDSSVKRRCKTPQDMQTYFIQFQGFAQELLMLMTNIMGWKFRIPTFMKGTLRNLTEKAVADIFEKNDWDDSGVKHSVGNLRNYSKKLGFSQSWISEFVFKFVMLARKEPKPKSATEE